MWTPRGSEYSFTSPSSPLTRILRWPLLTSPYSTVPLISAMMAVSRRLRASNSSTTRGRPPVMSLVLVVSRALLASTSPPSTSPRYAAAPAGLPVCDRPPPAGQPAGGVLGVGGFAGDLTQPAPGVAPLAVATHQVGGVGHGVLLAPGTSPASAFGPDHDLRLPL